MAKKAPKKSGIAKKKFDVKSLKSNIGMKQTTVKDKELQWIPFNDAWYDATGLPGIPKGECTLFRGFSDTGKSTAIYETISGAQKVGDFVVIIDTEGNFKFDRAREMGMQFTEVKDDEGNVVDYEGNFIYMNGYDLVNTYGSFDYKDGKWKTKQLRVNAVIEDVAKLIKDILKEQMDGGIEQDITFVWDSIGSIDCNQSETSGSSNSMWNAKALKGEFNSIMHSAIPNSKRETSPYTNTFAAVNKIWLQANAIGAPTVKQSGGDGFLYFARMIFHLGGKTVSGTTKAKATSKGEEYTYASIAKIEVVKNHVTNLTLKGKIASTAHGYYNPDKLDVYKKENKEFIQSKLGSDITDFNVVYEDADGNKLTEPSV
jgi:hypothetical protein